MTNLPLVINLIGLLVLSVILFHHSDAGIDFYITYEYREIDIHLLIKVGLLLLISIVLLRYVAGTSSIGVLRKFPHTVVSALTL